MYESISYELILQRMIDRVIVSNPNIDTREGSIIFDALAPAAMELKEIYISLDEVLNETFADTASREMLIKRVAERGIVPEPSTKAILKGEFNISIPIGARFSLEKLNYISLEKVSNGIYKMQCESFGVVGNYNFGALIPIDYIEGLETANLTELLIPGEDMEDTEHLRTRYFKSLDSQSFGGNISDYKEKTNAIIGVGGVKVYPVWNGGGTVKLVIINSDFKAPTDTLIDVVQTAIDPVLNSGEGVGFCPIGHSVTAVGVGEAVVDITTEIVFKSGWVWEDIKVFAELAIDTYLKELSTDWADSSSLIVRVSQIEIRLLNVTGVEDISGTTINGVEGNLTLNSDFIPVRGVVSG